uniref:uncharacterized protein LOC117245696 n=1 Tax=Epinephelus lanceolatus TaxID=310571 RepID=UPI00144673C2|nr:uncharacterized protein LOC117245696 [Epinephelus lanceolatus]
MPPTSLYFTLSLYFLSKLVSVFPYSYQTKPLFLSFSDLATLEANSLHQPNKPHFVADHRLKTFAVKCHEDSMEVVVKAYLFDPGRPVEPTHLRLGPVRAAGDHCTAKESGNGELVIRAALTECGSRVMFTRSSVLYNNFLLYSPPPPPPPSPGDVMQAVAAAVPVQCEYDRCIYTQDGLLSFICVAAPVLQFVFLLCSSAADAPELDVWTLAAAAAAAAALLLMIRRSRRSEEKENHWEAHGLADPQRCQEQSSVSEVVPRPPRRPLGAVWSPRGASYFGGWLIERDDEAGEALSPVLSYGFGLCSPADFAVSVKRLLGHHQSRSS